MQKTKWLSEEALEVAVKRREVKGKGEKQRYSHLNAEIQRIARRDKKPFLCDQCKETEENNSIQLRVVPLNLAPEESHVIYYLLFIQSP